MSYKVKLPVFEGPFDLLVYLIENSRMSIYDIQISEITEQYLDYVHSIKQVDFNMASEFMVLAATLLNIKSKLILPRPEIEGDSGYEEDPRNELVERILEYKKFKAMAKNLSERQEFYSHVYEKPQEDISQYIDNPYENLSVDAGQLIQGFELFLQKKKKLEEVKARYVRVEREKTTLESRMDYIGKRLRTFAREGVDRVTLEELIPDVNDPYDIVVTFVSVLQLVRDKYIDVEQKSTYGEIYVKALDKVKKVKDREKGETLDEQ